MGLIHQLKALRKRLTSLRQKEFCPQTIFRYELQYQLFSGSPACQPTLQILDLPACTTVLANSLKSISLSLSYMRTCNIMCCIYMRETSLRGCVSPEPTAPYPWVSVHCRWMLWHTWALLLCEPNNYVHALVALSLHIYGMGIWIVLTPWAGFKGCMRQHVWKCFVSHKSQWKH